MISTTALIVAFITFLSTYLGGLFSIRFKGHLHSIMAFTAGVLLWVVAFDILPEIMEMVGRFDFNPNLPMIALVGGFLAFHIFEKSVLIHHSHEGDYRDHRHPDVGVLSALALIAHSFLDGVWIWLGFQVDDAAGIVIAIAIISHDFTDGMNTVSLMLSHKNSLRKTRLFLLLDAVIPAVGVLVGTMVAIPREWLIVYLGAFAGFLLYIGASDILPEAHREKSSYFLIALTAVWAIAIYAIIALAKG